MPVKRYSLKPSHGYDGGVTVIEDTDGGMVTYEDYRELIGLLEEARDMIGWPHWSGTEAEQCDAAKKLVERIDARLKGANHG
jgi:hypothetical protein